MSLCRTQQLLFNYFYTLCVSMPTDVSGSYRLIHQRLIFKQTLTLELQSSETHNSEYPSFSKVLLGPFWPFLQLQLWTIFFFLTPSSAKIPLFICFFVSSNWLVGKVIPSWPILGLKSLFGQSLHLGYLIAYYFQPIPMLHVALGFPELEFLRLKTVDVIGSNLCPPEQCISTCISPSPARIVAQRVDLRQSPLCCNMLQHIYCIISNLDAHLGTALHAIRFMPLEGGCLLRTTMHQIRFMPLEWGCLL